MEKLGLCRDDLAAFGLEPLESRRRTIDERLRPRLEAIALRFATPLSRLVATPLSAAVSVTEDEGPRAVAQVTFFVAGAPENTAPFFRFAVSRGGVHARVAIARETAGREALAKKLARAATALSKELSNSDLRCYDDWDGRGIPAPASADKAPFWRDVAERLGRASGRLDVGLGWPEARAVLLAYEDLLPAYRALVPLYRRLAG